MKIDESAAVRFSATQYVTSFDSCVLALLSSCLPAHWLFSV